MLGYKGVRCGIRLNGPDHAITSIRRKGKQIESGTKEGKSLGHELK